MLVDGPSEKAPVPRHAAALNHLSLTPIVISKLPRATGRGFVKKRWEESKVEETFNSSAWAQRRAQFAKRRQLNDFERFKVMKLRKQVGALRSAGTWAGSAPAPGTTAAVAEYGLIVHHRLATRSARLSPRSPLRHRGCNRTGSLERGQRGKDVTGRAVDGHLQFTSNNLDGCSWHPKIRPNFFPVNSTWLAWCNSAYRKDKTALLRGKVAQSQFQTVHETQNAQPTIDIRCLNPVFVS